LSATLQRLRHRRLVCPHFRPHLLLGPQAVEPVDRGPESQTIEDSSRSGIHLYGDIAAQSYATPATDGCNTFIYNYLSCSIVSENCAITMLQLCYNYMMQKYKRLFCAGLKDVLSMPARCFGYARKMFWAGSQGCLVPSCTLRKGVSYLA